MRHARSLFFIALGVVACSSDPSPAADTTQRDATDDLADRPETSDADDVSDASDGEDVSDASDVRDAGDVRDASDASVTPVTDFCQRFAQAVCQRRVFCRTTVESGAVCIVRESAACMTANAGVVAQLRAGRMTFDADAAEACLSSLPEIYCNRDDLMRASPRCDEVFRGAVANGGACVAGGPDVCAEGYCPRLVTACPATCLARAAESMACDATGAAGAPCGRGLVCVGGVCRRALAADAACDEGASACGAGLRCVRSGATSTCVAPRPSGLACQVDAQCISGLCAGGFCAGGLSAGDRCSQAFQCPDGLACVAATATGERRCAMGAAASARCSAGAPACAVTLTCSSAGDTTCVPVYPGVDEACEAACVYGLWCRRVGGAALGVCARPAAVGGACGGDDPFASCVSPAACIEGVCRAPGTVGAPCRVGYDATCAEGLFCGADARCAARSAAGAVCSAGARSCVDGYRCVSGRCAASLAYGAACAENAECVGGVCLMGRCVGDCSSR